MLQKPPDTLTCPVSSLTQSHLGHRQAEASKEALGDTPYSAMGMNLILLLLGIDVRAKGDIALSTTNMESRITQRAGKPCQSRSISKSTEQVNDQ